MINICTSSHRKLL